MFSKSDSFHVCEFVAYRANSLRNHNSAESSLRTLPARLIRSMGNKAARIIVTNRSRQSDAVMAPRLAEKHLVR